MIIYGRVSIVCPHNSSQLPVAQLNTTPRRASERSRNNSQSPATVQSTRQHHIFGIFCTLDHVNTDISRLLRDISQPLHYMSRRLEDIFRPLDRHSPPPRGKLRKSTFSAPRRKMAVIDSFRPLDLQGYLAHKKQPPPRALQ